MPTDPPPQDSKTPGTMIEPGVKMRAMGRPVWSRMIDRIGKVNGHPCSFSTKSSIQASRGVEPTAPRACPARLSGLPISRGIDHERSAVQNAVDLSSRWSQENFFRPGDLFGRWRSCDLSPNRPSGRWGLISREQCRCVPSCRAGIPGRPCASKDHPNRAAASINVQRGQTAQGR